jgi:hypothetical protein
LPELTLPMPWRWRSPMHITVRQEICAAGLDESLRKPN